MQETSNDELGATIYWEIKSLLRGRPGAPTITVIDALTAINNRLANLDPAKAIAGRLRGLISEIVDIDDDDAHEALQDHIVTS